MLYSDLLPSWSSIRHAMSAGLLSFALLPMTSSPGGADAPAVASTFSDGFAYSASIVCDFREGPLMNLASFGTADPVANYLGMRNFFVTLHIFGKRHACEHAMSVYGPRGVIRTGLLLD